MRKSGVLRCQPQGHDAERHRQHHAVRVCEFLQDRLFEVRYDVFPSQNRDDSFRFFNPFDQGVVKNIAEFFHLSTDW